MKEWYARNIRRKLIPLTIAYILKGFFKVLFKTCRIEVNGIDQFKECASKGSCILMLWHNRLTAVAQVLETYASQFTYVAFVSKSRDGEIVASFTESYKGGRTIRVAHNRRDSALKEMVERLKTTQDIIMITPDGPKGPPHEVKPGVLFAAQETGAPIVPFSWNASRFWKMPTWDGLLLPKPFSTIRVTFGIPILVDSSTQTDVLKSALKSIE